MNALPRLLRLATLGVLASPLIGPWVGLATEVVLAWWPR